MLQDIIKQTVVAYNEHLAERLAEIPAGLFLCVHVGLDPVPNDNFKVNFLIESHILESREECNQKVQKFVYGPKKEDPSDGG